MKIQLTTKETQAILAARNFLNLAWARVPKPIAALVDTVDIGAVGKSQADGSFEISIHERLVTEFVESGTRFVKEASEAIKEASGKCIISAKEYVSNMKDMEELVERQEIREGKRDAFPVGIGGTSIREVSIDEVPYEARLVVARLQVAKGEISFSAACRRYKIRSKDLRNALKQPV